MNAVKEFQTPPEGTGAAVPRSAAVIVLLLVAISVLGLLGSLFVAETELRLPHGTGKGLQAEGPCSSMVVIGRQYNEDSDNYLLMEPSTQPAVHPVSSEPGCNTAEGPGRVEFLISKPEEGSPLTLTWRLRNRTELFMIFNGSARFDKSRMTMGAVTGGETHYEYLPPAVVLPGETYESVVALDLLTFDRDEVFRLTAEVDLIFCDRIAIHSFASLDSAGEGDQNPSFRCAS